MGAHWFDCIFIWIIFRIIFEGLRWCEDPGFVGFRRQMHLREEGVHRKLPPSTAVPVADPSNASRTQSRAWRVKRVNSFLAVLCGGVRPLFTLLLFSCCWHAWCPLRPSEKSLAWLLGCGSESETPRSATSVCHWSSVMLNYAFWTSCGMQTNRPVITFFKREISFKEELGDNCQMNCARGACRLGQWYCCFQQRAWTGSSAGCSWEAGSTAG